MRIGEVAQMAGLETSAIRYYESNGIVPEPHRSATGYRDCRDDDVELSRFVRRLRDEIAELQAAADQISDDWPVSCVCHILEPVDMSV